MRNLHGREVKSRHPTTEHTLQKQTLTDSPSEGEGREENNLKFYKEMTLLLT
jgi:hypothetical protein